MNSTSATTVHVLVLNYNGRHLLEECLPSVVQAVERCAHSCRLGVIDNSSSDGSIEFLRREFPAVEVYECENLGLCSFNSVLAGSDARVAVLLNNDIKLAADCLNPLLAPLLEAAGCDANALDARPCLLTAPLCWLFDGVTYEGFRTSIRWRFGLVQSTALFPGNEPGRFLPDLTCAAGAALAVDREKFLSLGGFDPLYLPGRIEDLDLAYRGYQAGYVAQYVPGAVAYHLGQATFGDVFGEAGCRSLAIRNTLLFQWKHLRHPWHLVRQMVGLPLRLAYDLVRASWTPQPARFALWRGLVQAMARRRTVQQHDPARGRTASEREYFQRFAPATMRRRARAQSLETARASSVAEEERRRARNYPLSRWYLRPMAGGLARLLARSRVRPWHLTVLGLVCALAGAILLITQPAWSPLVAMFVLAAWVCDRTDGQLARRQGRSSARGAWLDANVDELVDLGLHVAVACAASRVSGGPWPWVWLVAFLAGKYLLMYGLSVDPLHEAPAVGRSSQDPWQAAKLWVWCKRIYHAPGNADVRVHLLVVALAAGWLTWELALVGAYYNLRWLARYVLAWRRLPATCVEGGLS